MKKMLKRTLSLVLVFAMLITTFCFFDIGAVLSNALISVNEMQTPGRPDITFIVPEAVYLKYGTKEIQWWVGNNTNGAVIESPNATAAYMTFTSTVPCSSISITAEGAATINEISSTNGYSTTGSNFVTALSAKIVKENNVDKVVPLSNYSSSNEYIKWTCTYTAGGITYVTYAYTYVYSPFNGIIGGSRSGKANGTVAKGYFIVFNMLAGFHSMPGNSLRGYTNGSFTTNLTEANSSNNLASPLVIPIGTDEGGTKANYVPITGRYYEGGTGSAYGGLYVTGGWW